MIITVNISEREEKILKNDLLDIDQWVQDAVANKIFQCKKRLINEYKSPLVNKTDDELVDYVIAQPGYKDRVARDTLERAIINQESDTG